MSRAPAFTALVVLTLAASIGVSTLTFNDNVVILTTGSWRALFGADPAAIGQMLTLDGRTLTIGGMLSADFAVPGKLGVMERSSQLRPLVFDPVDPGMALRTE